MMRSGNPALKDDIFQAARAMRGEEGMTVQGTVNKTGITLFILMAAAMFTWTKHTQGYPMGGYMLLGGLGGFIVAMVTIFKKTAAPYTVPVYGSRSCWPTPPASSPSPTTCAWAWRRPPAASC
ncbi:MAG: hypothetical protein FD126_3389 [Elusimicrobia bacterium]|nr:MAG: hypothetical protein FD126_3389 [Elusimicrobiota bacterium]